MLSEDESVVGELARKIKLSHQEKWDARFLELALHIAGWSKDRSRRVGCVVVGAGRQIVATGYNGFPRGVDDERPERHVRPDKYLWTEHAERNAIYQAANYGIPLNGCTIYLPWYPCADCARAIVQAGIKFMVAVEPDWNDERFKEDFEVAEAVLMEGDVVTRFVSGFKAPEQKPV